MPKKPSAPKPTTGDNTPAAVASDPIREADAVVINNPAEGTPDLRTLPVAKKFHLAPPSAPVKRRVTLGSGTVREDR